MFSIIPYQNIFEKVGNLMIKTENLLKIDRKFIGKMLANN